ncbi:MAG: mechanosensitive ion channel, partial [Parvularculaceae bacterium]|nr:mechanosensitive ion channel [Parvularculaceae bacterium]
HRGTMARQLVSVAVALDADPRRVYDILLNAAREHALVLADPGPFVNWRAIGPAALEFELGVFIADVGKGLDVRNDLRFAILKAFRAEGVPFPRQDVHVHRAASALPGEQP